MSEAKHTPGPWDDNDESVSESCTISGGRLRLIKADGVIVAFLPQWPDSEEEADEAKLNSSLIKSAPDLLDALKSIVNEFDKQIGTHHVDEYYPKARAAIAKATKVQT